MAWNAGWLTFSGRWFVDVAPGVCHVGGGQVVEPGVGSVVVGVDVVADVVAGVVDCFALAAAGAASLELSEPGLDERLCLGMAPRRWLVIPLADRS